MRSIRPFAIVLVSAAVLAACGSGGGDNASSSDSSPRALSAETASFDLAANSPQQFSIGLIGPDQASVAYGTVRLTFVFDGPRGHPLATPRRGRTADAHFVAVPGQHIDAATPGPKIVEPSVARGVYKTDAMTFDAAGLWEATAHVTIDGKSKSASSAFEVLEHHQIPYVGDTAPHTTQALVGDSTVPAVAIDSRAQDGASVPDPELHNTTIASALDAHRPLMIVIATPTYCTSRFCGPVTDAVGRLATRYGDRMAFVHLEIWANFDNGKLNPWVNDWIIPKDGGDGREPWVFVVSRDGIITHRFDNLSNDDELEAAAKDVLQP